jgi:hypothetical protein
MPVVSAHRFNFRVRHVLPCLAAVVLIAAGTGGFGEQLPRPAGDNPTNTTVRYSRDIRPLLSDRCFQCHGPDGSKRQADLRLDLREIAVADRKHGPAIVPGNPDASQLVHRISASDESDRMPPADSHKRTLSPAEQDIFRRWISQGAVYEPHWAFVPPVRAAAPEVSPALSARVRNPIDRFIFSKLEAEGVAPSGEADKATVIRRAFLDLTGLPPTPEELASFLADTRPDAYERAIDAIFTTEPYATRAAERMTASWLDQARYADTCGIHMDAGRQMWLWRDWVIKAYRANMPFDQFVTEQLAGDLLPNPTDDQKIATGFNRNHVTTDEGGAIAEEYLVEYAVDRTATTGSVFLGLTLGCARCHDHKFDPITQDDFYRLYSYFNSIEEPGLYSQTPDSNRAYEPFLLVPTLEQKATLAGLESEAAFVRASLDQRSPEEVQQRSDFFAKLLPEAGITWADCTVTEGGGGPGIDAHHRTGGRDPGVRRESSQGGHFRHPEDGREEPPPHGA